MRMCVIVTYGGYLAIRSQRVFVTCRLLIDSIDAVMVFRSSHVTVNQMLWFLRLQLWRLQHRRAFASGAIVVMLSTGLLLSHHLVNQSTAQIAVEHSTITPITLNTASDLPTITDVMLIGDSLIVKRDGAYTEAFLRHNMTVRLDGAGSRSLRYGWLCPQGERIVNASWPTSPECRRQGLEIVSWWVYTNQLRDELVVALGTNDANRRSEDMLWSLNELRRMLGEHPIVLVGTSIMPMRQAFIDWNARAANWCEQDNDCRFLDWAGDPAGQNPDHFTSDGVHPSTQGGLARAEFIARSLSH
jgi:hypothetical protein